MALSIAAVILASMVGVYLLKANSARRDRRSVKAYHSAIGGLEHVVVPVDKPARTSKPADATPAGAPEPGAP